MTPNEIEKLAIDTIRTLSMDAVEEANSGHPGTPMALAPVAYCLWQRVLRFDPKKPLWPNRDRFVLSAGHASMLLYSLLHLAQVEAEGEEEPAVSLEDIRNFRQLDSRCPGHPEYRWTPGVEMTTGPLGQGVATSVGMAIAQKWLAATYNRDGFDLFDHDVYAVGGDGCMMEGISHEAASLAAHLQLDNLCWIYDSNGITIEGSTDLAFTEDVAARFSGYGWQVVRVTDANDVDRLEGAFGTFRETADRPTLIIVESHIGFGAPTLQDTATAHGSPLGDAEIRGAKRSYGWPEDAQFRVPQETYRCFQEQLGARGATLTQAWEETFEAYAQRHPELAKQLELFLTGKLPEGWEGALPEFPADAKGVAGRAASSQVLNALGDEIPWLLGGAADLAPSTKTRLTAEGAGDFSASQRSGRNFHFGVREHAMAAAQNGMALAGIRPYGGGFFVFSDYARPALRLAALMELPTISVFTHDSIGVGEDGPTHQPIEHLASLRAMPGMIVLRPADANEVREAWRVILATRDRPSALVLSRQAIPTIDRSCFASARGVAQGAYIVSDANGEPELILMASGSEVQLCLDAAERLTKEKVAVRVVSMPSWELFEAQDSQYQHTVLPPGVHARVAVEQASPFGWDRYVGAHGTVVGMSSYGASAPASELQKRFGFTVDNIVNIAKAQLARSIRA